MFADRGGVVSGGSGGRARRRRPGRSTAIVAAGVHELKIVEHDTELAALLVCLFVVPGLIAQPSFHKNGSPLLEGLSNDFGCSTKAVNIYKRHLSFCPARFAFPISVRP